MLEGRPERRRCLGLLAKCFLAILKSSTSFCCPRIKGEIVSVCLEIETAVKDILVVLHNKPAVISDGVLHCHSVVVAEVIEHIKKKLF